MARGRPIVIEFAANVRDYLRGTRDVERATQDIADELKDAARQSDKFERDFTGAMRDASEQAGRTSDRVKDDFGDMPGALGGIGEDAGDELIANLGEAVGSGDIGGIIEGTLGGIVGGLKGPLGLAAAALAGVAVAGFVKVREEAETLNGWYESWAEGVLGLVQTTRDELDAAAVEESYRAWIQENASLFDELVPLIEDAGLNAEAFARKLFEGGAGAQEVLNVLTGIMAAGTTVVEQGGRLKPDYSDAARAAGDLQTKVLGLVGEQEDANITAENYSKLIGEDAVDAVNQLRANWGAWTAQLRKPQKVVIDAEVRTTVTGPGAAYVNPRSGPVSSSQSAARNPYSNAGGTNRSR
jgi:hypothetical protein